MQSFPKKIVIDANILFSFFKKDSTRRKIIELMLDNECILVSPEFVIEELISDKDKIIRFSGIKNSEFFFIFSLLRKNIVTISKEEYASFFVEARKLSPHIKDVPYFALALNLDCPIWSDEKAFKQQSRIKILSTNKLLKFIP